MNPVTIAALPRQAVDEAGPHRIGDVGEDDGHGPAGSQQRTHGRRAAGQDDVRCEPNQFGRVCTNAVGITRTAAMVDAQVAAIDPAELFQPLEEGSYPSSHVLIVRCGSDQHPDAPHPLALLRARRTRHRRRAAKKADELPPPHSSTWLFPLQGASAPGRRSG
jgi:hypothetical protein